MVIHWARPRRLAGAPAGSGGRTAGVPAVDFFGRLGVVAAVEDVGFARLFGDVHHHRREFFGEDSQALFEVGERDASGCVASAWAAKYVCELLAAGPASAGRSRSRRSR